LIINIVFSQSRYISTIKSQESVLVNLEKFNINNNTEFVNSLDFLHLKRLGENQLYLRCDSIGEFKLYLLNKAKNEIYDSLYLIVENFSDIKVVIHSQINLGSIINKAIRFDSLVVIDKQEYSVEKFDVKIYEKPDKKKIYINQITNLGAIFEDKNLTILKNLNNNNFITFTNIILKNKNMIIFYNGNSTYKIR